MLVACAVIVTVFAIGREAWLRRVENLETESHRNDRIERMIALLEDDPRARLEPTRQAIRDVTLLADEEGADSAEVQFALGVFYHSFGDDRFEAAEAAFRNAIELRPDWSWAYNRLAIVLFESGRIEEAEDAWTTASQLDPEWARPFNDRAILYRRAKRFGDALNAVETAMELDPSSAEPLYNMGVILDTLGFHHRARAWYERSLDIDPTQAPAYYNIACGYGRRGELYPATFYLRRAFEINPRFLSYAFVDPDLEAIRFEPAFIRLFTRTYDSDSVEELP